MKKLPTSKAPAMAKPKMGHHGNPKPRLRTRHLSTTGKSAFAGPPPGAGLAFPPGAPGGPGGAPAFPPPGGGDPGAGGGLPDPGAGALAGAGGGAPGM